MNSHKNARLGFTGRVCLVTRVLQDGWSGSEAAHAFGVSARTVWKWVARYRLEGLLQNSQRSFSEFGWMLSAQDQEIVRNALERAHSACASEDGEAIRAALETLEHAARMITDAMFKPASVSRGDDDEDGVIEGGTKALPEST